MQLAELVEMMHSAQNIHRSVVNVPVNVAAEPDPEVGIDFVKKELFSPWTSKCITTLCWVFCTTANIIN